MSMGACRTQQCTCMHWDVHSHAIAGTRRSAPSCLLWETAKAMARIALGKLQLALAMCLYQLPVY